MSTTVKVAIAGAAGRMGQESLQALHRDTRFSVSSLLVRSSGQAVVDDIPVYTDAEELLQESQPEVWLDFTDARSVVRNVDLAISYGVRPVVGATGYTELDLLRWEQRLAADHLGGIVAPNFAIGALLMMRFAAEAAQLLKTAEIIELHHDGKRDAPSGTAKRTAMLISEVLTSGESNRDGIDSVQHMEADHQPSRGQLQEAVHIHSVRLPGLVAHQEVIFGGTGETLTIRHDSMSRSSFMPGVLLACSKVSQVHGLVNGLEHLLW